MCAYSQINLGMQPSDYLIKDIPQSCVIIGVAPHDIMNRWKDVDQAVLSSRESRKFGLTSANNVYSSTNICETQACTEGTPSTWHA